MYAFANKCFYPLSMKEVYEAAGSWPAEFIEVNEVVFTEYSGTPPDGKIRGTGNDGLPAWVDVPPPSPADILRGNEQKKQLLLSEANIVIAPLKDAMDDNYINDVDIPILKAWQHYRYALTKVDSTNPKWPDTPSV